MTKNLDKEGLSSIVDNYQLFYIDLWGVVHNGVTLHLEAIKALKEINKKRKDYILLTNAPRPNNTVKSFLERLGMEKEIRDHVFTSGEAALIYLKKNLINKKKKDYILLTNAPRPNYVVKSFLEKLGMEKEIRDHVFTSGEAALTYLKKNLLNKTFFHIGPPRDFDLFKDFEKMKLNNIEKCEYILCTGLFDDHNEDLNYYKDLFEKI